MQRAVFGKEGKETTGFKSAELDHAHPAKTHGDTMSCDARGAFLRASVLLRLQNRAIQASG